MAPADGGPDTAQLRPVGLARRGIYAQRPTERICLVWTIPTDTPSRFRPLACWAVDVEDAIRSRRTHKQYGSEPVDEATLRELFDLARFAPNHHLTQPWRFRVLGPETRRRVEELAGEKEAAKLRRAPTLVLATAALSGEPETDEEDLHATAAAVYAVLLGATGRGLASYWRTPACLREQGVRDLLGLREEERVVALVHLGPRVSEPPVKERAPLDDVLTVLP
jgi:nitroreductase